MARQRNRRAKSRRDTADGSGTTTAAAVVVGLVLTTPVSTCRMLHIRTTPMGASHHAFLLLRGGRSSYAFMRHLPVYGQTRKNDEPRGRGLFRLEAISKSASGGDGADAVGDSDNNVVKAGSSSSSSSDSLLHFFPRAASSPCPADKPDTIGLNALGGRKSPSYLRRRSRAKIKATPVLAYKSLPASENGADDRSGGDLRGAVMGIIALPGAVVDVVWGRPTRFVRRSAQACRILLVTRLRMHWLSFGMAAYIATTTVAPLIDSCRQSSARPSEAGNFDSNNLRENQSSRTSSVRGRHRQRGEATADESGDNANHMDRVQHLDDHAAGLWRDSALARAAGASTPTTATGGRIAEDSNPTSPRFHPYSDAEESGVDDGEQETTLRVQADLPASLALDAVGEALVTEEGLSGILGGGTGPEAVAHDLRTHTDLGDLELAAEKALVPVSDAHGGDWKDGANRKARDEKTGGVDGDNATTGDGVGGSSDSGIVHDSGEAEGQETILSAEETTAVESLAAGDGARPASASTSRVGAASFTATGGDVVEIASENERGLRSVPTPSDIEAADEKARVVVEEGTLREQQAAIATAGEATGAAAAQEVGVPIPSIPRPLTRKANVPSVGPAQDNVPVVPQAGGGGRVSTSFVASAARAVSPAVCRIDMERLVSTRVDTPFPDVEVGQGSGVIFSSAEGLVLTNAHVVAGASKVTVTLTDGRKFLATVKGADEMSDLAVLKIDRDVGRDQTPLPAATLGNSQELQVGDWVIAVGNPVGLDSTVTLGIVSSLKRSSEQVGFPDRKVTFIQTDAAINPGNSGGPLVNEFGEVVGINTAIRAHAEGIGFAIPINKAKAIMYELAEGKRIEYAYIGIHMTTITPEFAIQNNRDPNSHQLIPEMNGAIIMRVLPNTPASDAGLRRHDVVFEMNGRRVLTADDAKQMVDESRVGDLLEVKVLRGVDKVVDLTVRARDLTEELKSSRSAGPYGDDEGRGQSPGMPRPLPHPYPGAPPPAFPWGSSSPGSVSPSLEKQLASQTPQQNADTGSGDDMRTAPSGERRLDEQLERGVVKTGGKNGDEGVDDGDTDESMAAAPSISQDGEREQPGTASGANVKMRKAEIEVGDEECKYGADAKTMLCEDGGTRLKHEHFRRINTDGEADRAGGGSRRDDVSREEDVNEVVRVEAGRRSWRTILF